jgi:hypothetical protein
MQARDDVRKAIGGHPEQTHIEAGPDTTRWGNGGGAVVAENEHQALLDHQMERELEQKIEPEKPEGLLFH